MENDYFFLENDYFFVLVRAVLVRVALARVAFGRRVVVPPALALRLGAPRAFDFFAASVLFEVALPAALTAFPAADTAALPSLTILPAARLA